MSWPVIELGSICEFKYGKSLPSSKRSPGFVPVFGSNGIVDNHNASVTNGPTIVIGRKGSFGEVAYSPQSCWPIDTTYYVDESSLKRTVDLRWLYYRLAALGLKGMNSSAAIPGLKRDDAYRSKLMLPSLDEQKRIAAVLDRLEDLIKQRRKALDLLDNLAQSVFIDLFGNPKENPNDWPEVELSQLADTGDRINYGVVQPGDQIDSGIPLVRVGDLYHGGVNRSRIKRIDPKIEAKYLRSRINGTEILVGCVGSVGAVALVSSDDIGSNIARAVARIPIKDFPTRVYVSEYLRSNRVQEYFISQLRTVAQPTLNIKQLSETVVILPPQGLRQDFTERVSSISRFKQAQAGSALELDALFASVQGRAFRGELWETVSG